VFAARSRILAGGSFPEDGPIRIERVEPIMLNIPYAYGDPAHRVQMTMNVLFVRIDTDEGVTGWGEAFGFASCPVTRTAIERMLAPRCIGRDPSDIEQLSADLAFAVHSSGSSGPVVYARSGIDIALWDIAGKVAGKPIQQLLGGRARERIPAYASLLGFHDADKAARNATAALADGYRHVKLHETDTPSVAAARRAVGPDIPLMLDVNCAWAPDKALAMAHELEPYGLRWLEEPVWPVEDHATMKRIRSETRVPVAAGENAYAPSELIALARDGVVDVLQPSVTKIGGITAVRAIVAAADAAGVEVALHSPYLGPGLIATMHLSAAMDRDVACERFYLDLEASPMGRWIDVNGGLMDVPPGPGLGVDPDPAVLERYRVA
jgi:L-alanine-DL-glutamate epimerase-like enolase superfamily enzyme